MPPSPPAEKTTFRDVKTEILHRITEGPWGPGSLLPGEDDPFRQQVREWCTAHRNASAEVLARSGYVVPHWPRPWGIDATPIEQLVVDDELRQDRDQSGACAS